MRLPMVVLAAAAAWSIGLLARRSRSPCGGRWAAAASLGPGHRRARALARRDAALASSAAALGLLVAAGAVLADPCAEACLPAGPSRVARRPGTAATPRRRRACSTRPRRFAAAAASAVPAVPADRGRSVRAPEGFFPRRRLRCHTQVDDPFDTRLSNRSSGGGCDLAASKLRWLQDGRIQLYVLYIAVTMLVLLIWKLAVDR